MLAFSLALIVVKGITMLLVLLFVAAFMLMVTALTYQFQGWLAALMSNPRRRRTVIMIMTLSFVLIVQLPNLLNFLAPWGSRQFAERAAANARALAQESEQMNRDLQSRKIDPNEAMPPTRRKSGKAAARYAADRPRNHGTARENGPVREHGRAVRVAAAGRGLCGGRKLCPGRFLGLVGMTLIGSASLYRAYRTTIGMYQGQFTNRKGRAVAPVKGGRGDRAAASRFA